MQKSLKKLISSQQQVTEERKARQLQPHAPPGGSMGQLAIDPPGRAIGLTLFLTDAHTNTSQNSQKKLAASEAMWLDALENNLLQNSFFFPWGLFGSFSLVRHMLTCMGKYLLCWCGIGLIFPGHPRRPKKKKSAITSPNGLIIKKKWIGTFPPADIKKENPKWSSMAVCSP